MCAIADTQFIQRRPSPLRVLAAPWLHIAQPGKAAVTVSAASWKAFLLMFMLGVTIWAWTIVFLVMWDETVTATWSSLGATQPSNWSVGPAERSFTEVWQALDRRGGIHPMVTVAAILMMALPALAALAAWLFLPTAYGGGSPFRSYARAFRGVASGIGLLTLLTAFLGACIVEISNDRDRGWAAGAGYAFGVELQFLLISAIFAAVWLLVFWIGRAIRATRPDHVAVELPPRCEGCGYDLTHRPDSSLCPECGLDVDSSLTPEIRRPGSPWEEVDDGVRGWVTTSINALVRPRGFYGEIKLRSVPRRPVAFFAGWHYLSIGVGAALWAFISAISVNPGDKEALFLPCVTFFLAPLLGWGIHRIVAAVATSTWIAMRMLPDVGWARRVIAYETPYLWVYCLFNGTFITSLFVFDAWVTRLVGHKILPLSFLRVPPEAAVVLAGNLVLTLIWLWRYHIAARAIRWSNF